MSKIIIIEDDISLRQTLEEYLSQEGFEVYCASDGEEGLKLIQEKKPDAVLLDIIIPKIDGFELLKRIKSDEATAKIPVVLLTNLSDVHNIEKALELGATTYMVKADYKMEEIVEKVRGIIKKKEKEK